MPLNVKEKSSHNVSLPHFEASHQSPSIFVHGCCSRNGSRGKKKVEKGDDDQVHGRVQDSLKSVTRSTAEQRERRPCWSSVAVINCAEQGDFKG